MKQLLFTKGPQGPIGATLGTAMNNFYSSPNKVSTHYITSPFSFWIWRRRCLKFAWFWPFGALPLGPHGGHTYDLNNFESPTPKDDSCQVWLKSNHAFSRRRWKCNKFTDDGRKRTAIAHLSLRLRWAKKKKRLGQGMRSGMVEENIRTLPKGCRGIFWMPISSGRCPEKNAGWIHQNCFFCVFFFLGGGLFVLFLSSSFFFGGVNNPL